MRPYLKKKKIEKLLINIQRPSSSSTAWTWTVVFQLDRLNWHLRRMLPTPDYPNDGVKQRTGGRPNVCLFTLMDLIRQILWNWWRYLTEIHSESVRKKKQILKRSSMIIYALKAGVIFTKTLYMEGIRKQQLTQAKVFGISAFKRPFESHNKRIVAIPKCPCETVFCGEYSLY